MKKTIKSSKILGPLFQLTAGSAIAQLITIMASPLTTRLFTSEDLGIYTLILTIISIFGPVLNGKFDMSIVKSKDHDELVDYLNLSLIIGFLFSIFVSVGYTVYLFNNKVIMEKVGLIIFVILPIILMASALINTLISLNNFEKNYYLISKVYVVRNISQNIMMISAGLIHLGVIGLMLSQLASLFFGIKSQAISLKKELIFMKQRFSILNIKKSFLKEKNQLIYLTPATVLNSSAYSVLNFFITNLFGLSVFGYYSMSYRILGLPLSLISGNVSRLFYKQAVEEKNNTGSYFHSLKKFLLLLIAIAIPMVLILYFFSPFIFEIFFGENWIDSGYYVRALAPMYGIRLVVSAVSIGLLVSNKQQLELVLQLFFILSGFIIFLITDYFKLNPITFFNLISISFSIIYVVFLIFVIYYSRKKDLND
ncbi:oligosaccharide flippase family protein [Enterococcus faecium]|uniref:oligosaccharide flippase family protein n=1 Tax=Enterococcus faecium TaxID=1352 RepID=UPI000F4D7CE1|nr:oligosaccharide flippase family protein [Enterococcus faecium]MBD9751230.1 oligosaccharide flippase family protein [Enterococcus faecium]MDV7729583.1 oligosaccharide flippase family protein [Enterococcus faecium]MDW3670460.1 oligosaccharide flippase family protein [Enterococcus faecium]ROY61011.1 hypothetical protein EGW62_05775 [Enterococcus faecium]ROZ04628.1 hypothetical protein EGW88_05775 [Enterococcus faecium]